VIIPAVAMLGVMVGLLAWKSFTSDATHGPVRPSLVTLGVHQIQDGISAEWRIKQLGG